MIANYKVIIYSGNLDIIVGAPLTEAFMSKLDFNGSAAFHAAARVPYTDVGDGEVAGYVKHAGNLTQVVVRGAGHILPHDQPKRVSIPMPPTIPPHASPRLVMRAASCLADSRICSPPLPLCSPLLSCAPHPLDLIRHGRTRVCQLSRCLHAGGCLCSCRLACMSASALTAGPFRHIFLFPPFLLPCLLGDDTGIRSHIALCRFDRGLV